MKIKAYNNFQRTNFLYPTYDVEKWAETVRDIYDLSKRRSISLKDAQEKVLSSWDPEERRHFVDWVSYYENNEQNLYNLYYRNLNMKNTQAQFFGGFKKPFEEVIEEAPKDDSKQQLQTVRQKIRSRLKSVKDLIYTYEGVLKDDQIDDLISKVNVLEDGVRKLTLKASMVDSIIRTASGFKKLGFSDGANELQKIAQEVAQTPVKKLEVKPEINTDVKVPDIELDHRLNIPNFNNASLSDALKKLEEVNKVISERNVIRAISAVDIILGQLGIASYFPQLSEAQSKLMEAYNYAGSRVAETIGMMRAGQGVPAEEVKVETKPTLEQTPKIITPK